MKESNQSTILEIRQQANIVEIISEFVVLKNAGRDYRGLCPFHNEKSPSFHVNLEKGIFKCFGCGVGGDVFSFLQKVQGKSFPEVVKDLATRFGIQVENNPKEYADTSIYYKICESAKTYYQELLINANTGGTAQKYLASRNIKETSWQNFQLGLATNTYDGLINYLVKYLQVTPVDIEKAGLARHKDGRYYDLFRNRLILPIVNEFGKTIAFGGRALDDNPVKYLNSPETPIFIKGNNLFGLNLAKEKISQLDYVILVEGYLDVIMAHQFGFNNTLASLGTALTPRQAKLLLKFTKSRKVYLAFDNDKAGHIAIDRGIEMINELVEGIGCDLKVLTLPSGKDMADFFSECGQDSVLVENKVNELTKALDLSPNYLDFRLNKSIENIDINVSLGKIQASQQILPILAQIKSVIARSEYIKIWANKLMISEVDLASEVQSYQNQAGLHSPKLNKISAVTVTRSEKDNHTPKNYYRQAEFLLLAYYFADFENSGLLNRLNLIEFLISPDLQQIGSMVKQNYSKAKSGDELFDLMLDTSAQVNQELNSQVVNIWYKAQELINQKTDLQIIITDALKKIIKEQIRYELPQLLRQLNNLENSAKIQSIIAGLKKIETSELIKVNDIENLLQIQFKVKNMLSFNNHMESLK